MYLFPYESVSHGARVVIYGAGMVGQDFLHQLMWTDYCIPVALVDKAANKYQCLPIQVVTPNVIPKLEFDKLIIALDHRDIAEQVAENLIRDNPNISEKMILGCNRKYENITEQVSSGELPEDDYAYLQSDISIAVYMKRGIGDCIFAKRFLEALFSLTLTSIQCDLFVSPETEESAKLILDEMNGIRNVFVGRNYYNMICKNYDLSFELGLFLEITDFKYKELEEKDVDFLRLVISLKQKIKERNLSLQKPSDYYVHIKRCEKKGQTCYTGYSYDGLIPINDWHTTIPLREEYNEIYQDMKLPSKYITLNYSWNKESTFLPKYWPLKYFNKLAILLKKSYPDYKLIQIGMEGADKISGLDIYLLGHNMELIKFILKGAELHIDYEGGPVHLATQLGTKCVVLFGAGPYEFFKYHENINVRAQSCHDCLHMDENYTKCFRGLKHPECMYKITPELVMQKITAEWCGK